MRICSVFLLILTLTTGKAAATAVPTATTLETLISILNTSQGTLGNSTVQNGISGAGVVLSQVLSLESANINGILGKIESLNGALEQYQKLGGNPTQVINSLEDFKTNYLPKLQVLSDLAQLGDTAGFLNVLQQTQAISSELVPFIGALTNGAQGLKELATNFAIKQIASNVDSSLLSTLGILKSGLETSTNTFGQIPKYTSTEFQGIAKEAISGITGVLDAATSGLFSEISTISGIDSAFAQAAAAISNLPGQFLGATGNEQGSGNQNSVPPPPPCTPDGSGGGGAGIADPSQLLGGAAGNILSNYASSIVGSNAFLGGIGNALGGLAGGLSSALSGAAGIGGGGGLGVPVIEQDGKLLSTTEDILKINTENRTINLQSCNYLSQIWWLMSTIKVSERVQLVDLLWKTAKQTEDALKPQVVKDYDVLVRNAAKKEARIIAREIQESDASEQTKMEAARSLATLSIPQKTSALASALRTDDNHNLNALQILTHPTEGILGKSLAIDAAISDRLQNAAQTALTEANNGGGVIPVKKCIDENHNPNDPQSVCRKEIIVQSAGAVANAINDAQSTPYNIAINSDNPYSVPPNLVQFVSNIPEIRKQGDVPKPNENLPGIDGQLRFGEVSPEDGDRLAQGVIGDVERVITNPGGSGSTNPGSGGGTPGTGGGSTNPGNGDAPGTGGGGTNPGTGGSTPGTGGSGGTNPGSGGDTTDGSGSSNSTIQSLLNLYRTACRLGINLPFCGNSSNTGNGNTGGNNNPPPQTTPNPSLTIATTTEHLAGITFTRVTWQSQDMQECHVTNNWISFGSGTQPSLSTLNLFTAGQDVTKSGTVAVFHPAIFAAFTSATEAGLDTNNTPPGSQIQQTTNRIVINSVTNPVVASTVTQTARYSPNVQSVETDDIFTVALEGQSVGTFGNASSTVVANNLYNAFLNTDLDDAHKSVYQKYQFATSTGAVSIIRGIEVEGIVPVQGNYQISCTSVNNTPFTRTARIRFNENEI